MEKNYQPSITEPQILAFWQQQGIYHFDPEKPGEVFSIDAPPPTVSGHLHMGHVYSYTHADIIARFKRMRGYRVFYPMGFDDNGLPTDRLVEKKTGKTASQIGRQQFQDLCIEISQKYIDEYAHLLRRVGLSFDETFTYRTIDHDSQRISQWSFLELFRQGRVLRQRAPAIFCPECRTSIAQADLEDESSQSEFIFLPFRQANPGGKIGDQPVIIATTRPELLAACVAVFINPEDARCQDLSGSNLIVPLYGQSVPVIADPAVDPHKGSGVVMCCTFGDTTDIFWQRKYALPVIEAINPEGCLYDTIPFIGGLPVIEARSKIITILESFKLIVDRLKVQHEIRVHERCKLPVEYTLTQQWFVRILDQKQAFNSQGKGIHWYPEHMAARYQDWVDNLGWDWCISRQRAYGVPFPIWYCQACGEINLADHNALPVNPVKDLPTHPCRCGSNSFLPETDVMDTWATSSLTPQIAAGWQPDDLTPGKNLVYQQVAPYSLRSQAQEIIRTWAFYTIAKSYFHFSELPWKNVLVSGWGLAGAGQGKISKSRQSLVKTPHEMIGVYSADAVRYWAASTAPGKDSLISEEKIALGARMVTKLWNIALFAQRFLPYAPSPATGGQIDLSKMTLADRWILARLQSIIQSATSCLDQYEYAAAKSEIEGFFWKELSDNYIEMIKQRLYDPQHPQNPGARFSIHLVLLTVLKLLAPFLPFVTEKIYQDVFAIVEGCSSIHISPWPTPNPDWEDAQAERTGEMLITIASAVRRYKSERALPLGTEINRLQLAFEKQELPDFADMVVDLKSITRARSVEFSQQHNPDFEICHSDYPNLTIALEK